MRNICFTQFCILFYCSILFSSSFALGSQELSDLKIEVREANPFNPNHVSEIKRAQNLLYDVYVEEMGWRPDFKPTGLRVNDRERRLKDDYDRASMRFNVYIDGKIAGSIRLAGTIDGKFEFEHFNELPKEMLEIEKAGRDSIWEVNRLAVKPEFRTQKFRYHFLNSSAETKNQSHASVLEVLVDTVKYRTRILGGSFFGAPNSRLERVLNKMGIESFNLPQFKYSSSDANHVKAMYYKGKPLTDSNSVEFVSKAYHKKVRPKRKQRLNCFQFAN